MSLRRVDFRAEYQLRTRTLGLLQSNAAMRVQFRHYSGFPFYGGAFAAVALAIRSNLIGFETGTVPANAGAAYNPDEDLIKVPTYAFGQDDFGRYALIHECVHAYFDILGTDTPGLFDESVAYIAGTLFSLNYERPGSAPVVPSWGSGGVYATAFPIALSLYGQANPVVSPVDGNRLETAILASPAYPDMTRKTMYRRNGVRGASE